ncbi:hypothetical protein D0N36_14305 [Hymenobacter lapidiphilus]|uniref:deoxynucleoside kinase n=1 Tax=Hymenobacter sp. CCM 8763 TaxID=2303334 RepID=UPI000E3474C2|nr:deoxynucleoside kinase [Hymenobacter sp. CCM 8763]RFP64358.1 hypothetical protein D0N36_14305 [Hymenobacter sp. CCM 8763]
MYICLEGLKGCGKSTLLGRARQLLTTRQVSFDLVAPTSSAPLERSWTERMSAWAPCLRRLDAWNERLYADRSRYATEAGQWQRPLVLGDRSIVTSYATRWHKWADPHQCVSRVNTLEAHLPAPDHIILLDLDPGQAWERAQARQRTYGQCDETLPRLRQAREAYEQIRRFGIPRLRHTQWHVLDAGQEPAAVFHDWQALMTRLAPGAFAGAPA